MGVLHNRVSQKELKEKLYQETQPRVTLSFYQYFLIEHPQEFRDQLYQRLVSLNVFGRIYVAHEGINAQLSVPEPDFAAFREYIRSINYLNDVRLNIAVDDDGKSFWVLKIKIREKIVADGITDPAFDMQNKGRYVDAAQFNRLTEDSETIVVDMRNHYEYEVGHFKNAIEVPSDTFREQLPMSAEMLQEHKEKNIIMYCTGGIRCEKASAYLLHRGFKNVFHLEGGISNKFQGKNFVFDDRLGERISHEVISTCHQCGDTADTHTNCKNEACHLLFIQCATCAEKYEGCCSEECLTVYRLPEEEQKLLRKGKDKGMMVFNKSRRRKPLIK
jgi:UPF0176 protein